LGGSGWQNYLAFFFDIKDVDDCLPEAPISNAVDNKVPEGVRV